MNKRGIEHEYLIGLLIVIAGVIVLFGAFSLIKGGIENGTDSEICRNSVLFATGSKYISFSRAITGLKCVTKNKLYIDKTNEQITTELVKDIYDCSYQYWDGKLDFSDFWESLTDQGDYCFVCYIERASKEFKISPQDLANSVGKAGEIETILVNDGIQIFSMDDTVPLFISFHVGKRAFDRKFGIVVGKAADFRDKCEVHVFKQKEYSV